MLDVVLLENDAVTVHCSCCKPNDPSAYFPVRRRIYNVVSGSYVALLYMQLSFVMDTTKN